MCYSRCAKSAFAIGCVFLCLPAPHTHTLSSAAGFAVVRSRCLSAPLLCPNRKLHIIQLSSPFYPDNSPHHHHRSYVHSVWNKARGDEQRTHATHAQSMYITLTCICIYIHIHLLEIYMRPQRHSTSTTPHLWACPLPQKTQNNYQNTRTDLLFVL